MKYQLRPVESSRDYAAELNAQQYEAVRSRERHALVIAGAGSGKTRVLTYRVAWLIEQGVAPWRILLLTFTNKASGEMLKRVKQISSIDTQGIWGGTFHSIANRMLRRHAELLGYGSNFSILDSDDQNALMKSLYKQALPNIKGMTTKQERLFPKPKMLLSLLSYARSAGLDWHDVLYSKYPDWAEFETSIESILNLYAQRKKENNAMDFDDLLVHAITLLENHSDVLHQYQERFAHVLVDEYQDTNAPQERLINLLAGGEHSSLMAVGDDAQSIYSWRGASVEHILQFQNQYPDAAIYKIEINYRSVPAILELSNAAISQNSRQYAKELKSHRDSSRLLPALVPLADKRMEARFVAQRIDELTADGSIRACDIVVLYRAHFHAMDVQMELLRNHIPFRITSGQRFFEQAHIKDVLAFLRLLVNPRDEMALQRILLMLPRVGAVSAQKISTAWLSQWSQSAYAQAGGNLRGHFTACMGKLSAVGARVKEHWLAFLHLMDALEGEDGIEMNPTKLIHSIVTYLKPHLESSYENMEERYDDILNMVDLMPQTSDLDAFLAEVTLMSELDHQSSQSDGSDEDKVCLSTIHQAKGLEWKVVFILSLAEELFPHKRVIDSGSQEALEEETRLFYVAITRAEDQLYLLYPRYSGGYGGKYLEPSSLLAPLGGKLVDVWEV